VKTRYEFLQGHRLRIRRLRRLLKGQPLHFTLQIVHDTTPQYLLIHVQQFFEKSLMPLQFVLSLLQLYIFFLALLSFVFYFVALGFQFLVHFFEHVFLFPHLLFFCGDVASLLPHFFVHSLNPSLLLLQA